MCDKVVSVDEAEHGLSSNDFVREFSTGREWCHVARIDLRRPKYPISATRIPDGKVYKFTAENVALLLQVAMKDVSSNRQQVLRATTLLVWSIKQVIHVDV